MQLGLILFLLMGCCAVLGQEPPEALDGPHNVFHDDLLDNLVGEWRVAGKIRGKPAEQTYEARWALNHQFLRLHEVGAGAVLDGQVRYEAMVFIGYDNTSDRYVAHWLDVYGGRFSETVGYGTRSGNSIRFVFEYPEGPFHNTFIWQPKTNTWHFVLETKNSKGKWMNFADLTATKQ